MSSWTRMIAGERPVSSTATAPELMSGSPVTSPINSESGMGYEPGEPRIRGAASPSELQHRLQSARGDRRDEKTPVEGD